MTVVYTISEPTSQLAYFIAHIISGPALSGNLLGKNICAPVLKDGQKEEQMF